MKKESEGIGIAVATQEAAVSVGEHSNLRDCENTHEVAAVVYLRFQVAEAMILYDLPG